MATTPYVATTSVDREACKFSSAASWSAIIAGAVIATAVSITLLMLGSSLGFAIISPWSNEGVSVTAFTLHAAVWLLVMQWVSSAIGGYITGRLRNRWFATDADEVFFRDTANGFIAWAVATVFTIACLTGAASMVVNHGLQATSTVASGAAAGAASDNKQIGNVGGLSNPVEYYVDSMYRSEKISSGDNAVYRNESALIFANYIINGDLTDDDKSYLSRVVAARSGVTPAVATDRVNTAIAKIDEAKVKTKEAADKARKAAASASIFTFISLLVGAFIASVAAAIGGRHRDLV